MEVRDDMSKVGSPGEPEREPDGQPAKPVRRQARGLARIAAILDAAEAVIAEAGYAAATTNSIAARAGMSPGSLYQFFRNKDDILDALVECYYEDLGSVWSAHLGDETAKLPLEEFVERLLSALLAFKTERPAFWSLLYGSPNSDHLAAKAAELHERSAARIAQLLRLRSPGLDPARAHLVASMSVATGKATMPMVMEAEPGMRTALLAEVKALMLGYLRPVLNGDG
ncbi:TetR/AcrR family transcriptional regulator [Flindersiella endophytica]